MRTKPQIQADIDKIKAGLENELIPEPIKADMRKNALPKLEQELKEAEASVEPKAEKSEKPDRQKKTPEKKTVEPKKEEPVAVPKPIPESAPKPAQRAEPKKKAIPLYISGKVYKDVTWEDKGGKLYLGTNVEHPFEVEFNGVVIPSKNGQKMAALGDYKGQLVILDAASPLLSGLAVLNRYISRLKNQQAKPKTKTPEKTAPKPATPAKPLEAVPEKVKALDKADRPDRNMTDKQAKCVAGMIEDYRSKGSGRKVEQVVIMKDDAASGDVVLFLHDTTELFFPKFYLSVKRDGSKGQAMRNQPKGSYRIVMGKKSFRELYSTKLNTEECAISARKLFAGDGDSRKLGQYLHTCGDLHERKAKVANLHQASAARYAQLKEAGLAYAKENTDGITYAQVLSITSGDFLQDEKITTQIDPKKFITRIA